MSSSPVDWERVADCLWERLFVVSFLYAHVHDDVASLLRTLACVCTSFRAHLHRTWRELDRPYLSRFHPRHAYRTLECELQQRRMIASLVRHLGVVGVHDVCVAGGFAAWHLERWMDTEMGRDAFPRTVRGTHVWSGRPMHRVWTPSDVDVFVHCDDPSLVISLVLDLYRDFCDSLHLSRVCTSCVAVDDAPHEGTLDDPPREEDIERLARDMGLPERVVDTCVHGARRATAARPWIVRRSYQIVAEGTREVVVPLRVHVLFTRPPPPTATPYVEWVLESLDIHHCRVAVEVSPLDGRLSFVCSAGAFRDLAQRRLRLTDRAFHDRQTCRHTLRRIDWYLASGFTLEGDDASDVDHLIARARLHDRVRGCARLADDRPPQLK